MQKLYKKTVSLIIFAFFIGLFSAPAVFAVECDEDGDQYITISYNQMQEVVLDNLEYKPDGNYPPEQWQQFFDDYKQGLEANPNLNDVYICDNINFKKGAEPSRCDEIAVKASSGVFDSSRVSSLSGKKVNPGAYDSPDNGIDEDCDGSDSELVAGTGVGEDKDIGNLTERIITLLSRAVVVISLAFLILGGIMYATAAGNEQKTSRARKTIIGAIIGLAVGLLAPTIVNYIAANI